MMSGDLLALARDLLSTTDEPDQVRVRRAVSTTYYAVFHTLAGMAADEFAGADEASRDKAAWLRVYRALDHGFVRQQCRDAGLSSFPIEIRTFAGFFSAMQIKRHAADYDPSIRVDQSEARIDVEQAATLIPTFLAAPARDRRAFAAFVLLKSRRD